MDWLARVPVPEDGRLPLVGDADGRDVGGSDARFVQSRSDHLLGALPDFRGVVFHPAAAGEYLLVLPLVRCHHRAGMVKEHTAGAGCAGINGSDVLCHGKSSCRRTKMAIDSVDAEYLNVRPALILPVFVTTPKSIVAVAV